MSEFNRWCLPNDVSSCSRCLRKMVKITRGISKCYFTFTQPLLPPLRTCDHLLGWLAHLKKGNIQNCCLVAPSAGRSVHFWFFITGPTEAKAVCTQSLEISAKYAFNSAQAWNHFKLCCKSAEKWELWPSGLALSLSPCTCPSYLPLSRKFHSADRLASAPRVSSLAITFAVPGPALGFAHFLL